MGVLALEGASVFVKSAVLADFLIGFRLLGGLLNLREGLLALEEGYRALQSNDKALATRLFLQGVLECGLGVAMIVLSIGRIFSVAAITGAFAANPYVLPVLFFALSLFLLIETAGRLGPAMRGTDLGSKLNLPELKSLLKSEDPEAIPKAKDWVQSNIGPCGQAKNLDHRIGEHLDRYKGEVGFLAAIETFLLFEMILKEKKKSEILEQIEKVETQLSTWNKTLAVKFFSVILFAGGFGAGMGAIANGSPKLDASQNLLMSAASAVPLALDIGRPFEREIPIVVQRNHNK